MTEKTAELYRMDMAEHTCPFGLKSKDLLQRKGFKVEDHRLTTREETDAFKARHDVKTTPQTFINGERIGGYEALRRHFGMKVREKGETSYRPVLMVFLVALALSLATGWAAFGEIQPLRTAEWFVAFSMSLLAMLKLQDVEKFSTMFLNYDLLAKRQVRYGYVYPWAEGLAGVLMVAGVLMWVAVPVALFIGTVGAVSVIKAVYVDKRELKCACVGGDSNVPLGFLSLTENLAMIGMGLWMGIKTFIL